MGHHTLDKSSLAPLIDRLNKYPIGLVDNDKLRQILSLLFGQDEAYVASRFPLEEATLEELEKATGMAGSKLLPILERMAEKGLVADMPYKGVTYYLLIPGLIGFFEFTFMKSRTDIPMDAVARLMAGYLEERGPKGQMNEILGHPTHLTRALTHPDEIPVTAKIASYDDAREIIKNAGFGAVGMCYCRHKKEHQGIKCKRGAPIEGICISLGVAARFLSRRGFMQEKSVDELLDILKTARSYHLTHVTENVREKPSFLCNCCRCCCVLMHGIQMGYADGVGKTPFLAEVDESKCDYCGKCMAACNAKAIGAGIKETGGERHRVAAVDSSICLGCGACVSTCAPGAISLAPRAGATVPPRTHDGMFGRMMWEKGRLWPLFISRMRKLGRNLRGRLAGKGRTRPPHILDT